jgi:hypothetical protein
MKNVVRLALFVSAIAAVAVLGIVGVQFISDQMRPAQSQQVALAGESA